MTKTARAPARKLHPLPPWLLDAFKAVVADCDQRDAEGLPALYSTLETFFYPQQSTYFLTCGNDLISPGKMQYNPPFFVWDPFALNTAYTVQSKAAAVLVVAMVSYLDRDDVLEHQTQFG